MAFRLTIKTFLFYCLVHFSHVSLACILLLNGWTPLTVYERSSMADIVAAGEVLKTYKDVRSEHGTFSAQVRLFTVHKGEHFVDEVRRQGGGLNEGLGSAADRMVFNVSNFGDKAMCYADVTSGESYVFFLTVYKARLSAKYDDIFGAVADYTTSNERQILDYLGWNTWSQWGPCSLTCGDGQQTRERQCGRNDTSSCEGSPIETRHCNTFSCSDVVDLLSAFGIPQLPFGVTASEDRKHAYVIATSAKLFLPVNTVFDVTFPRDFSLVMTARRTTEEQEGYVLVLSDISGRQRFAVHMGQTLRVEYMDKPDRAPSMLRYDVTIEKGKWHQVALRVQGRRAVLYFDCNTVIERKLKRGNNPLGTNLMLSVGPYFANYGPAFQGELEQLILTEDPSTAERQCHFQSGDHIGPVKDDSSSNIAGGDYHRTTRAPPKNVSKPTTLPALVYADWSSWSACSVTCGKGRQSRSLSCTASAFQSLVGKDAEEERGHSGRGNCVPNDTPRVQVRPCWVQECAVPCTKPCQNGGTCMETGQCRCLTGYHGDACQSAVCTPGCQNGGTCTSPGKCSCPKNFTGNSCESPNCDPPCLNGGRCNVGNVCSCPYGYTGSNCEPYCQKECHNGGQCVRHDQCRCSKGYAGRYCQRPVCRHGCSNGGKCVAPNRCSCPSGYRGRRCHKPRCRPSCKNGGKCIAPGVCRCGSGMVGPRCQKYKCNKKCRNGGKCVPPGKCQCPSRFFGRYCQKERCNLTCLNGGRCRRHKNRCRCPKGFRGRRCEKRSCVYERYTVPYKKTYRRTVKQEVLTSCGPWNWKSCMRTVTKYVTVTKDSTRTAYRCV